jgi:hypothetical protein
MIHISNTHILHSQALERLTQHSQATFFTTYSRSTQHYGLEDRVATHILSIRHRRKININSRNSSRLCEWKAASS